MSRFQELVALYGDMSDEYVSECCDPGEATLANWAGRIREMVAALEKIADGSPDGTARAIASKALEAVDWPRANGDLEAHALND